MKKIIALIILNIVFLVGCGNVTARDTSLVITEANENVRGTDVMTEYENTLLEVETLKTKNLKKAYSAILVLRDEYPDDTRVKNLFEEVEGEYIDACIQKITEFINNEDYFEAIELYDSEKALLSNTDKAIELYQSAVDEYFNFAIEESDEIFYSEGAEAACANIVRYKIHTVDSQMLDERLELYKSFEPVRMIDLDTFYFEGMESYTYIWGPNDKDNLGNDGFWGYRYYVGDTGWKDENRYKYCEWKYTYLLNGEYDFFDAVFATAMESKDYVEDNYDAYLEVYNGDILLFESEKIRGGIEPKEIHVDITNVEQVTVVIKGRAFNCGSSKKFEVGLLNPTFSKVIPETFK